MKSSIKIIALVSVFFLASCVKDLDFDQASELELTPSYVLSLVNFKIPQTSLIDEVTGNEKITISDRSSITILNTKEAQDSLEKLILKTEIANTFDRDFSLTFHFLNNRGEATYKSIKINVVAEDLAFTFEEEIIVANNPSFLATTQVEAVLELQPSSDGSKINPIESDTFTLKSAATLFFRINNN